MLANHRTRATAVIIKNGNVLLIRRTKPNHQYYILPGGGVEEGETVVQAFVREAKEELGIDVVSWHELFTIENVYIPSIATRHQTLQTYHCFSVDTYEGIPQISGEEKASMTPDNLYEIEWVPLEKLGGIKNIYPYEAAQKLAHDFT